MLELTALLFATFNEKYQLQTNVCYDACTIYYKMYIHVLAVF